MKKISLLFINIYEGAEGGGEVYLYRLISCLHQLGTYDIFIMTPECEGLTFEKLKGVKVIPILGVKKTNVFLNLFRFIKTVKEINSYFAHQSQSFDYVIMNAERASYLSPFLRVDARKVLIRHMLIDSNIKSKIAAYTFKHSDRIVTISHYHKSNYINYTGKEFEDKIHVIYNAVDTNEFSYSACPAITGVRFIQIGSLELRKGAMDTLSAFKLILEKYPSCILTLVGKGPLESQIMDFIKEYQLENNVQVLGFRKDIHHLLSESHVFILPSYSEGLPLSILESFSSGRPSISSNVAGIPEIIDSGVNGFLISPGDIDGLKNAMLNFCEHPDSIQRMGSKGREKVVNFFNQEKWVDEWNKLFVESKF